MAWHKDWFSVDKEKRAARVRSYPLPFILREALANSLDAKATEIEVLFSGKETTRSNREGNRAYKLKCTDNGCGCDDPEVLRRVGSSTSDLDPEKRGRFGHGLIDVLSICDNATILTKRNRLVFEREGCDAGPVQKETAGLVLEAVIRHGGEGMDDLERYFASMMLPLGVNLIFNGVIVQQRKAIREILQIQLPTVVYDPSSQRMKTDPRKTKIHIYEKHGEKPMIHELGIPVDAASWELPYDIDVLQKTPLDMERCILPTAYKDKLISKLVNPLSDLYEQFMKGEQRVPREIRNEADKADKLSETARETAAKIHYGRPRSEIARRNPLDPQDRSQSQELEVAGALPVNTAHAPEGMKDILHGCSTVAEMHRERCQAHVRAGNLPAETDQERLCIRIYSEIAAGILGYSVAFSRCSASVGRGGCLAMNSAGIISLNIKAKHLWEDPLGAESLGVMVHECAHEKISGHTIEFQREIERLAGTLAVWVGRNPDRWKEFEERLKK